MYLDSYSCENCILQRQETVYHLFFRCNFATRCWESIGLNPLRVICPQKAVIRLKRQLRHDSAIEIIILYAWCIWKCRNGWIFKNEAPTVIRFRLLLTQELRLLQYRVKEEIAENIVQWMQSVQL
jgi:hypothetical protein